MNKATVSYFVTLSQHMTDMGCRCATDRMTICQIQFEPRISWIQSSNVTHEQLGYYSLLVLTEVYTSHSVLVCLAMVWRSTGLVSNFLCLCAHGTNTLDLTLKFEIQQHPAHSPFSILGNLLIYKPLFTLHFKHIFKLRIKLHVLQILFVNNKSYSSYSIV
jgi:hypothetical protein